MVTSSDFGEALLQRYGKLRFVSSFKDRPETTIEIWTLDFLLDTLYVITIEGEPHTWSDNPSIVEQYQTEDFNTVTVLALT